ncbi:MAG: Trp family transcriptional regulator [Patescibacteria group bacterium]
MPHISKEHLDQKVFLDMYTHFHNALTSLRNKKESGKLIRELLTPTERVMIAKRVAMIYMLRKGHSVYEIEKVLKVSSSTVARYSLKNDAKKFTFLLSIFKKSEGLGAVFDTLEKLLSHRTRGKGRWDFLAKY